MNAESKATRLRTTSAARRLVEMADNPATVEEAVRKVVSNLLKDIPIAPTQLDALREPLLISEFCAEDVPFSGELRREGETFRIVYSKHLSDNRRRFTIAHELGHAILEKTARDCDQSDDEVERLCDMLAAEILMPSEIFLDKMGPVLSIQKVFELRKIFQVSLTAVALRCFEFQRASIFEIQNKAVKWGCGRVKKGPIHRMETWLQSNIEGALEQPHGVVQVLFEDKGAMWKGELEWNQRSPDRTLFLLTRRGRHSQT